MNFETKKILITGGSSGIGKAIIAKLYHMGARDIAVMGRYLKKDGIPGNRFSRRSLLYLEGSVAELENIKKSIGKIKQQWKGLDILINSLHRC
jgi:NAD(P)-dependent dehydrogenase (short-subunit alcohol dehydrogenase family)